MVYAPPICREIGTDFPDCRKCSEPGAGPLRERWGCEEPARSPVFAVACSACAGDGCIECDGSGERAFYRCPRRVLVDAVRADIMPLVGMYHDYAERNLLPEAGGMRDQAAATLAAFRVIDDERAAIERERDEYREQQRAKQGGWR